ncbi:hypothetical protein BEWA_028150 [Theileria equi strain WA]|uniref:Zinc finger PHD-type domain-containing protein n=1 Tax=Theileria equi strain WA TaxID=1537102 RepID=L0AY86_THEEQ|nr:hypothetical protein BEWA_028150 [Theileria equi strain WA]AFZ79966.1 hypothetical protein BEWA_028150 [Theileria equi strain WA]|eukprot:XP_004829632.1 hypothetical protein BEWA_028150 [Theileria equi strain WA]
MEVDSLNTLGNMFTYKEWIKQKDGEPIVEAEPVSIKKKKTTKTLNKKKSTSKKTKTTQELHNTPSTKSIDEATAGFAEYVQSIEKCTSITRLFTPKLARALEIARKKGFEPRMLADVLSERKKLWAKTQCIHSSAREDFLKHTQLYRKQFWGYKKSVDGWITESKNSSLEGLYGHREKKSGKTWSSIIYCPNFKPGGEVIHRFSRKTSRMYKTLYDCIVDGWVHPDLVVCEITDATHPVRFATPPEQDCYTAIYVGPEISADSPRIIFGEYTGIVYHEDSIEDSVFEYAFELNFASGSWINADYADTEEMIDPAYKNFGPLDQNVADGDSPYSCRKDSTLRKEMDEENDTFSTEDFTFGIVDSNGTPCKMHDSDVGFAYSSTAEYNALLSRQVSSRNSRSLGMNKGEISMDLDAVPIGDINVPMKDTEGMDCTRIQMEKGKSKMTQIKEKESVSIGIKKPTDCIYLPSSSRYVLDSTTACNELSLVNHCQTISAYGGEFWIQPNCEWQQVIFDGWPHIVLTSKEGVKISPGDELVADFGALWFAKVEETAHKSLRRELIEYRTGIRSKVAKRQTVLHSRPIEDIDRWLVNTGHFGKQFTCAICNDQYEEDYKEETACVTTPSVHADETTEECVSCDGCDRVFHLSCMKNLSGTAANMFAKQDGVIVWKTDTEPFKGDRSYTLGKWFCMYCRYLAKQIYMHDIGSDYMPISKSISSLATSKSGLSTCGNVDQSRCIDASVQTEDPSTASCKTSNSHGSDQGTKVSKKNIKTDKKHKHVRGKMGKTKSPKTVHGGICSSSGLMSYLHKTYIQHESNRSGSVFDKIMHKIFKKHKMHKMKAMERFSPLQLLTGLMRDSSNPDKRSSSMEKYKTEFPLQNTAVPIPIESGKTKPGDDTPSTRAFTPINRRNSSSDKYDTFSGSTYTSEDSSVLKLLPHAENSFKSTRTRHSDDDILDTTFLTENIKRIDVGNISEVNEKFEPDNYTTYIQKTSKKGGVTRNSLDTSLPIIHTDMNTYNDIGVTDYLTCRYLFGMWHLEAFSLFGDTVRVCTECNQRSGPRANVYVCRILKRHLGGNFDHPESTNVAQMREYVLMAYEQHVHFLLRLLVLKNISIHFLVKTCCHFIGKQLLYNKDLSFSENEVIECIDPTLVNLKGLVNKDLCMQKSAKVSKTTTNKKNADSGKKNDKRNSDNKNTENTKRNGVSPAKIGDSIKKEDSKTGEDLSEPLLGRLTKFLSEITDTVIKTPRFDGLFNYGLLKAMGAFTEEYTRIINCDEIIRYINDLTTYISYDGDQIPGHLQQMLNKAEMERFSNFKHLAQKTESPFSETKTVKIGKKKEKTVFVPLLGIVPGKSLVYRKFSDGYYQGTVTAHDVHRGVHVSFKIEYSDGDDEIMHPEELLDEILLNIGDPEKILRELSENDSRNEQYLSRLGQVPDIPTVKRLAGKLRKVMIKSLMAPKIGLQKRQNRLV